MTDVTRTLDTELGEQVRHGARWSLFNTVLSRALSFGFTIVMARILLPDDYGVFTAGYVLLMAVQSMNELGVSVAIVRWQGDPTRAARTATTLAISSSAILGAAMVALAPVVADAMHSPKATNVIRLLAVGVLLDGYSSIAAAFLTRAFRQRSRTVADIAGVLVSSIVTIVLAKNGHGAMSLAWGSIAGNAVVTTIVLVLTPLRPRPGWRRDDAAVLIRFGLPLAATSFVLLAVLNVDYVIVSRVLGATALGFYMLAFNLSAWPSNLLSIAVRRVAVPGFARVADQPETLWPAFARSFAAIASLVGLAGILLAFLGDAAIEALYGSRWALAFEALRWLAILGAVRVLIDLCYDALAALGASRALLAAQLLWLGSLAPALVIGSRADGIRGAGIAHAGCALLVALPTHLWALHRKGLSFRVLAAPLTRPVLGGTAAAGLLAAVGSVGWSPWPRLAVLGVAASALFAVIAVRPDEVRRLIRTPSVIDGGLVVNA